MTRYSFDSDPALVALFDAAEAYVLGKSTHDDIMAALRVARPKANEAARRIDTDRRIAEEGQSAAQRAVAARAPSQPEPREALAEKLVDAILTWKSGHVVEGLAQQYRAASQPAPALGGVHNHGPEDGPGVRCREHLIGACRLATLDAARTPSQPDRPVGSYPFAEVCPGCGRSDEHAAPCTVRVRLPGHATPSQPDLREALVTRLAIHLHQKGVGCDGHVGDDRAVADVHRDDAYDIYDFIASQPAPRQPGRQEEPTKGRDAPPNGASVNGDYR